MSYGKERPIDPRSSEEGWARNRNAQTVLIGLSQR
jgi:peptidoglycan-associated lipoprotein